MEKRRFKRHRISLKAERISINKNYGVFIENISETGIHILTTHSQANKVYLPGREIDLNFCLTSGKSFNLHCRVRWAHPKTPPDDLADSIGLEVIDPPVQYIEFVHSLH
ncbi:MAG: PilZ domain-containing protein [Thermodesulfovibrionales bacterium]|nr:PilZ domain-containing protein [Thermodesulfovibrionales bacterium]